MIDKKVYYLAKISFLADLNTQELIELAQDFEWQSYPKGTEIIRQGHECRWFYILTEGKADAWVTKSGLSSVRVGTFEPGDTFGEIPLVSGKPSPNTVRCLEGCKVLALDSDHFAHMLVRWPKLYQRFTEQLSHILNQINHGLWEAKHKEFLRSALQLTQYEYKFYGLWGSAKTTKEVESRLADLSKTQEHLLIIGERGTGRQMMAWYLHKRRFGEEAPFVVVDGRLFDQQWGDNLSAPKTGENNLPDISGSSVLDIAEGGTLLIRDINLISPRAQLKLSEALNIRDKQTVIVGSLAAGTELELNPELKRYFIDTFTITPLRHRKRDIPVIAQGVLDRLAQQHNRAKPPVLNQEATKLLLSYNYRQGNVTELIRVIERAFFLADGDVVGLEHVFFGPTAPKLGGTLNLLSWQKLENLFKTSSLVLWLQRISTGIFLSIVGLLLLVPQAVATNNLFVLVWGLWWPALAIVSPFLGRLWCTACPFAFIMEFVQKKLHLDRPVPDFIKKYDYLIVTFFFILIFWVEVITRMRLHQGYTLVLLALIQLAAIGVGLVFARHTWCRHLCPLGGFVGVASIGGMLEVRSDATYCLNKCTTYECYKGTKELSGCPMFQHAPFLDNNLDCKLCFHCVRNCPNSAVKVNLRVPAREVWHLVRVNQGYAVFIVVTLAILFPILYFNSFRAVWPAWQWNLWFSLTYWGTALGAGLLTWLVAQPFRTKGASRRIKLCFALTPVVLAGHIAYQLHYIPGANSLLLGLGLKTPDGITHPFFISALTAGQIAAALIGLCLTGFSVLMVLRSGKQRLEDSTPPSGSSKKESLSV